MATDALATCLADGQSHVRAAAAKAIGPGLNFPKKFPKTSDFLNLGKVGLNGPKIPQRSNRRQKRLHRGAATSACCWGSMATALFGDERSQWWHGDDKPVCLCSFTRRPFCS